MLGAKRRRWPAFGPRPIVLAYPPWLTENSDVAMSRGDPVSVCSALGTHELRARVYRRQFFMNAENGATIWTGPSSKGVGLQLRPPDDAVSGADCGATFVPRKATRFRDHSGWFFVQPIALRRNHDGIDATRIHHVGTEFPVQSDRGNSSAQSVAEHPRAMPTIWGSLTSGGRPFSGT